MSKKKGKLDKLAEQHITKMGLVSGFTDLLQQHLDQETYEQLQSVEGSTAAIEQLLRNALIGTGGIPEALTLQRKRAKKTAAATTPPVAGSAKDRAGGGGGGSVEAITREVLADERGAMELLRALQPVDGVDVLVQRVAPVAVDDDEWLDSADDSFYHGVEVSEADLNQINTIIGKLAPLSQQVLEEVSDQWRIHFHDSGDHMMYRTNIAERIRFTAAQLIVGVASHYQCLHNTPIHNNSSDDMMQLINNLVLQLWQGISMLHEAVRQKVAVIFDLDPSATSHDICVNVTGLAITTLFRSLPVPLLETVCKELRITPKQKEKIDPDVLHEALTHQICCHVYPSLSARADMNLRCATSISVAENGPGSFTCTILNAWMLSLVPRDVYTSNQFTCSKIKWRAQVAVCDSSLSFAVTQRSKAFNVRLTIRSTDAKKKKRPQQQQGKGGSQGTGDGADERGSSSLFVEVAALSTPKSQVVLPNVVSVLEMFAARTDGPGMRLYNHSEDKVVFQFTLEATSAEPPEAESEPRAVAASHEPAPAAVAVAKGGADPKKDAKSGKGAKKAAATAAPPPTIEQLLAQEEEEKREKANAKNRQKVDKKRQALEQEEQKARERVAASSAGGLSQLQDESARSFQRAQQKLRDREKREATTKALPNVELQAQVAELTHEVQQKKSVQTKLASEEKAVARSNAKLLEKLEERRAELEQLRRDFERDANEAEELEREIADTRRKKVQKAEEAQARAAARQRLKLEELETAPPTAAIKDFQSFWSAPGAKPTDAPAAPTSPFRHKQLFSDDDALATTGPGAARSSTMHDPLFGSLTGASSPSIASAAAAPSAADFFSGLGRLPLTAPSGANGPLRPDPFASFAVDVPGPPPPAPPSGLAFGPSSMTVGGAPPFVSTAPRALAPPFTPMGAPPQVGRGVGGVGLPRGGGFHMHAQFHQQQMHHHQQLLHHQQLPQHLAHGFYAPPPQQQRGRGGAGVPPGTWSGAFY